MMRPDFLVKYKIIEISNILYYLMLIEKLNLKEN